MYTISAVTVKSGNEFAICLTSCKGAAVLLYSDNLETETPPMHCEDRRKLKACLSKSFITLKSSNKGEEGLLAFYKWAKKSGMYRGTIFMKVGQNGELHERRWKDIEKLIRKLSKIT